MDFDLLFKKFPQEIVPYDYARYARCEERFEMVTTECATGQACYFEEKLNEERIIDIVRASSSLPFVCPIAKVDGREMLDGGIADSLPMARAMELGYDNNVVVLTRNAGYRKSEKRMMVPWPYYRRYPALREKIRNRNIHYNSQMAFVEERERRGEIVVIRPERPIVVGRMERDVNKLRDLYDEGYEIASRINFM